MSRFPLIGAAAALGLLACACAAPGSSGRPSADSAYLHCQTLTLDGAGERRVCATPEQWDEARATGRLNADVRCRERLMSGLNVHETLCATEDAWDNFERWQRYFAERQVLRMQGSAY